MTAKAMTSSAVFVIGGLLFSAVHAQAATQTANISAAGAVSNNAGWITSVSVNSNSSGSHTRYVVNFAGPAPGAPSCNVTPAVSGLNTRIANPVSMPSTLIVTFSPSAGSGLESAASDFVLTCAVQPPVAAPPTPMPPPPPVPGTVPVAMSGTQIVSIGSNAMVTNNNGWVRSATYVGSTGYPPNAYVIELAGQAPPAANCQVSPAMINIGGYPFTPAVFDGNDGTSVIVRYAPPPTVPNGSAIPAATSFTLTCVFPS